MSNSNPFSEIEVDGEQIHDWDHITLYNYSGGKPSLEDVRLYYHPNSDTGGFSFCVVQVEQEPQEEYPFDDPEETYVSVLMHGWAAHDGVRHLYFGGKSETAYFNTPKLRAFQAAFEALRDLEGEHCENSSEMLAEVYPTPE